MSTPPSAAILLALISLAAVILGGCENNEANQAVDTRFLGTWQAKTFHGLDVSFETGGVGKLTSKSSRPDTFEWSADGKRLIYIMTDEEGSKTKNSVAYTFQGLDAVAFDPPAFDAKLWTKKRSP